MAMSVRDCDVCGVPLGDIMAPGQADDMCPVCSKAVKDAGEQLQKKWDALPRDNPNKRNTVNVEDAKVMVLLDRVSGKADKG